MKQLPEGRICFMFVGSRSNENNDYIDDSYGFNIDLVFHAGSLLRFIDLIAM
jgi:hypothetical protein